MIWFYFVGADVVTEALCLHIHIMCLKWFEYFDFQQVKIINI